MKYDHLSRLQMIHFPNKTEIQIRQRIDTLGHSMREINKAKRTDDKVYRQLLTSRMIEHYEKLIEYNEKGIQLTYHNYKNCMNKD